MKRSLRVSFPPLEIYASLPRSGLCPPGLRRSTIFAAAREINNREGVSSRLGIDSPTLSRGLIKLRGLEARAVKFKALAKLSSRTKRAAVRTIGYITLLDLFNVPYRVTFFRPNLRRATEPLNRVNCRRKRVDSRIAGATSTGIE